MGVIPDYTTHENLYYELLPRYGGYSISEITKKENLAGCFPVMGVIPNNHTNRYINRLVASPLWGLFLLSEAKSKLEESCFPVRGVILLISTLITTLSCFPVMGVIPSKRLAFYQGLVASPLWGLFHDHADSKSLLTQLLPRYGGYSCST